MHAWYVIEYLKKGISKLKDWWEKVIQNAAETDKIKKSQKKKFKEQRI